MPANDTNTPAAEAPAAAVAPARNVWLVPHPTHQWAQDIKALARKRGLIVVDPAAAGPDDIAAQAPDAPELTPRGAPVKKSAAKSG